MATTNSNAFSISIVAASALPAWVPSTVGAAGFVPMTNTLSSVSLRSTLPGDARGDDDTEFYDFSGGVYNRHIGALGAHVVHGGGHSATDDNSVFLVNYNTLQWERVSNPVVLGSYSLYDQYVRTGAPPDSFADSPTANPREIAPGVPGSAHTYDMMCILPPSVVGNTKGGLLRPVSTAVGRQASRETGWAHLFNFDTNTWSRFSTSGRSMGNFNGGTCAFDPTRNRVHPITSGNVDAGYLNVANGQWVSGGNVSLTGYPDSVWSCYVPDRDIVVAASRVEGTSVLNVIWFGAGGESRSTPIFSGTTPPGAYTGSMVYVPELQRIVYWTAATPDLYYEIDVPANPANPWPCVSKAITGAARPSALSPAYSSWVYRRMDYSPQLKSLLWVTGAPEGVTSSSVTGRVVCIRIVS